MTILLMSAKWSLFLMMPTDALVDEYVNTHSRTRINKTLGEIPKNILSIILFFLSAL